MKLGILSGSATAAAAIAWITATTEPAPQSPAYPSREDTVRARRAELRVRIDYPKGKKPCPAMVYVHGSGKVTRSANRGFVRALLDLGFAVAAYDKRGVGDSTGVYRMGGRNLFRQLAGDAVAVYEWLVKQKGIDASRVGFVGGSQAGWIMPIAADHMTKAAFVVAISGPSVSGGEEMYYSKLTGDRQGGGMTIEEADRRTAQYDGPRYYDPRDLLRRLEVPCLWVYGGLDESIPPHLCATEISKIIVAGSRFHTLHVVPGVDHNLRDTKTKQPYGVLRVFRAWFENRGIL